MKKDYDNIQEVAKFNPFHDAAGKFSSSEGMRTYSANPKTKAGQMAIARSDFAGHGHVMNVHRESKGENITQNQRWITTGQKPKATVKPKTTAKPKVTAKPKTTATNQNATKQPNPKQNANDRKMAVGKDRVNDIVANYQKTGKSIGFDDVLMQQGFKDKPQVAATKKEFNAAAKASGVVGYRTINPGRDALTRQSKTSKQFADLLMNGEAKDVSMNGNGRQVYGKGLYVVTTTGVKAGTAPSASKASAARSHSELYGGSNSSVVEMTLSKNAKTVGGRTIRNEFKNQPYDVQAAFGYDANAYAAAKGYDAVINRQTNDYNYATVFNRSALVMAPKPTKNNAY